MSFLNSLKDTFATVQQRASTFIDNVGASSSSSDANFTYITQRILTITFPEDVPAAAASTPATSPAGKGASPATASPAAVNSTTKLHAISNYLERTHHDHYLILNLSERSYSYDLFQNNVIEYRFPGYPSPPLDRLLSINQSIHSWLQADSKNVLVIHCQSGKGRTVMAVAAYLVWARVAAASVSPNKKSTDSDNTSLTIESAVDLIASRLRTPRAELIIPSQQRYLQYIDAIYRQPHTYPSNKPIVIERILMNTIPRFETANTVATPALSDAASQQAATRQSVGQCRPYLQIFKEAKLLHTSTGRDDKLHWYSTQSEDQSVTFAISPGLVVYGDLLVRVRHIAHDAQRLSMLRFGIHTGLLPPGHLRLSKAELDGANTDSRFDNEFFIELIYRQADEEDMQRWKEQSSKKPAERKSDAKEKKEGVESSKPGTFVDGVGKIPDDQYWQQLGERIGMTPLATHELVKQPTAAAAPAASQPATATAKALFPAAAPTATAQPAAAATAFPTTSAAVAKPIELPSASAVTNSIEATAASLKQKFASTKFDFWNKEKRKSGDAAQGTVQVAAPAAGVATPSAASQPSKLPTQTLSTNQSSLATRQSSTNNNASAEPSFTVDTDPAKSDYDDLSAYMANLNSTQTDDFASKPGRSSSTADAMDLHAELNDALNGKADKAEASPRPARESLPPSFGDHPALDLLSPEKSSPPSAKSSGKKKADKRSTDESAASTSSTSTSSDDAASASSTSAPAATTKTATAKTPSPTKAAVSKPQPAATKPAASTPAAKAQPAAAAAKTPSPAKAEPDVAAELERELQKSTTEPAEDEDDDELDDATAEEMLNSLRAELDED